MGHIGEVADALALQSRIRIEFGKAIEK